MGTVRRGALLMASGTAVSRVLGVIRNATLVGAIGVNLIAANAFDVANKLPNILFALLASGMLNSVLVPQIVRAYKSERAQEIIDKLLTAALVIMVGLTVVLTVAAPLIIRAYIGTGWTAAQINLAVTFGLWCIPQLLFYGIYTLLGQVLNAREQFGPYMWAPVVNNVISIIGFGVFIAVFGSYDHAITDDMAAWTGAKITLLAGTATAGIVGQALVLLVPLYRSGFRWHLRFGLRGVGLRSAGQVAGWTFAAGLLDQIGVLLITRIGSGAAAAAGGALDVAGNAAYSNALALYLLPHSLVTVSIATALFTRISKAAADKDLATVRADLSLGLRTIGLFTVFAASYLMVAALPLILLTTPSAGVVQAQTIAPVLMAMAPGIIGLGMMVMLRWVFFAFEDGRTVFMFQVPATVALVAGSFLAQALTPPAWWVVGIGASMTVSGIVVALGRLLTIRSHVGEIDLRLIGQVYLKAAVAGVFSAGVGWGMWLVLRPLTVANWLGAAISAALLGLLMALVYLVVLRFLSTDELALLLRPVFAVMGRVLGTTRVQRLQDWFIPAFTPPAPRGPTLDVTRRDATAPVLPAPTVAAGTLIAGRYRLDTALPDVFSPQAQTWRGVDEILDSPIAVRLVSGDLARASLQAARRATRDTHATALRILAAGTDAGRTYIITAPPPGVTLGEIVRRGALPAPHALTITAALGRQDGAAKMVQFNPDRIYLTDSGPVVAGSGVDAVFAGLDVTRAHPVDVAQQAARALAGLAAYLVTGLRSDAGVAEAALPMVIAQTVTGGEDEAATPADLATALGEPLDLTQACSEVLARFANTGANLTAVPLATSGADQAPPAAGDVSADAVSAEAASGGAVSDGDVSAEAVAPPPLTGAAAPVAPAVGPAPAAAVSLPATAATVTEQATLTAADTPVPAPTPPSDPASAPPTPPSAPVTTSAPPAATPVLSQAPPPLPDSGTANLTTDLTADLLDLGDKQQAGVPRMSDLVRDPHQTFFVRRFHLTPFIVVAIVVAIIFGVLRSLSTLSSPIAPLPAQPDLPASSPAPSGSSPAPSASSPASSPAKRAFAVPSPTPAALPTIVQAGVVDPNGDGNEHPEELGLAYDGNPDTFWRTRTYNRADMGRKAGVGYQLDFQAPVTLSKLTLQSTSQGGKVEIRLPNPADPAGGQLLASGSMTGTTTFTFAPTQMSGVVVWVTQLPQTGNKNRLEINEITFTP